MESIFHFGLEISKTFTASVVLQLADEKKLNLDDSVEKWLPGVIKVEGMNGSKITMSVIESYSGLASYTDLVSEILLPQNPYRYYSVDGKLIDLESKPPVFAPGKGWNYSNMNAYYPVYSKVTEKRMRSDRGNSLSYRLE
nr:serine hydrolase domain-containing protein [Bacillus mycoides]